MDWSKLIYLAEVIGAICVIGAFFVKVWKIMQGITHLTDVVKDIAKKDEEYRLALQSLRDEHDEQIKNLFQEMKERDKRCKEEDKKQKELLLSMARSTLLISFTEVMARQEMTMAEYEVLHKLYDAYTKNGGNSVICELWNNKISKIKIVQKVED